MSRIVAGGLQAAGCAFCKGLRGRQAQGKVTMKNHRKHIHLKYLLKLQIKLSNRIQSTKHHIKRHSTAPLYITVLVAQNALTFQIHQQNYFYTGQIHHLYICMTPSCLSLYKFEIHHNKMIKKGSVMYHVPVPNTCSWNSYKIYTNQSNNEDHRALNTNSMPYLVQVHQQLRADAGFFDVLSITVINNCNLLVSLRLLDYVHEMYRLWF